MCRGCVVGSPERLRVEDVLLFIREITGDVVGSPERLRVEDVLSVHQRDYG